MLGKGVLDTNGYHRGSSNSGAPRGVPNSVARRNSEAGHNAAGLLDLGLWQEIPSAMHWADALQLPPTEQDAARLRQATLAGLPLGKSEFVGDLEQAFARRLIPGRPGRKPKSAAVAA